jgi:recombination protein RecA
VPIDLVIGGGIPLGRFTEVMGDPGTCKTVLALLVCKAAILQGGAAFYLDPEAKVDGEFAQRLGVPWDKLIYRVPTTLQETFTAAYQLSRKLRTMTEGPIAGVIDSIAATALDKEIADLEESQEVKLSGEVGNKARALSVGFPLLLQEIWARDVALVGCNHLKIHLGSYFRSFLESPGGRAIWYHASVRLLLRQRERIKNEAGAVTGIVVSAETVKNSVSAPFRQANKVHFSFTEGFDPWKGASEVLLRAGRIKPSKSAGWFRYEGLKFRERDLPEIVEQHPKLVEAL